MAPRVKTPSQLPAVQFRFSEEFKAKMREIVKPISVQVLREVESSPDIYLEELTCTSCGFRHVYSPPKLASATAIHDCIWTHEFSWKTGARCGGQFAFVTSPVFAVQTTAD
jgi:hypothetical protein